MAWYNFLAVPRSFLLSCWVCCLQHAFAVTDSCLQYCINSAVTLWIFCYLGIFAWKVSMCHSVTHIKCFRSINVMNSSYFGGFRVKANLWNNSLPGLFLSFQVWWLKDFLFLNVCSICWTLAFRITFLFWNTFCSYERNYVIHLKSLH